MQHFKHSRSVLMAIFPSEPGLAGTNVSILDFIGATDDGGGDWWVVTTGAIMRAKLQSNRYHKQTYKIIQN